MRRITLPAAALLLAAPVLAAPPPPAAGEETPDLVLGGEITGKVQSDVTAINRTRTRVNVFSDIDLKLWANYKEWLSVNAQLKLERNRGTNINSYYPDRNQAFRSESITLRQLYATLRPAEGISVDVGKFHTLFGAAYERTPGQFYSFASDYEQDERVGVRLQAKAPEAWNIGPITASIELFMLDSSILSSTLPRGPAIGDPTADRFWRYTRGAFGPANTGSLASWTASLQSEYENGFSWKLSATRQATSDPTARAEEGISFSAGWDPDKGIALTPHLSAAPFAEYARFNNALTIRGLTRQYLLGGVAFVTGKWELDVAAGMRESTGTARGTDHDESVTLTYEILDGFKAGAGIHHVTLNGRGSWTLAPALQYSFKF